MEFLKYEGAGNDFILVDDRKGQTQLTTGQISRVCNRHFGIGADGLMLLRLEAGYDFRMVYYNSDGNESTMCGNGGRCIVAFAKRLGLVTDRASFMAIDGPHQASIGDDGSVELQMNDVQEIRVEEGYSILNTGSPHYVKWVSDVAVVDVFGEGRAIRNEGRFQPAGINVNFVQEVNGRLKVRTYERGVEDETLSCGTGVTAAAIASTRRQTGRFSIDIDTPGGKLNVSFFKATEDTAQDVVLTGPATFVFAGEVAISQPRSSQ